MSGTEQMRQWNLNPKWLCRQHLLGEHNEMHKAAGAIRKGKSIAGYLTKGWLDPRTIRNRHRELVREIKNRHYNHESPLPQFNNKTKGNLDLNYNLKDLLERCARCRARYTAMT
jgi:hypothetical protein